MAGELTYGAVLYLLYTDGPNQRVPVPMPAEQGQWTHIPFGGNVWETAGTLHTVWSPRIKIPAASWSTFRGYYQNGFYALIVPAGFGSTKYARLAQMDLHNVPGDPQFSGGVYEGSVTWEWAG